MNLAKTTLRHEKVQSGRHATALPLKIRMKILTAWRHRDERCIDLNIILEFSQNFQKYVDADIDNFNTHLAKLVVKWFQLDWNLLLMN